VKAEELMSAPTTIAGHVARFDRDGQLLPWTSWTAALEREMNFYQQCPLTHGYAHTDVIHNYVDALSAFPYWGSAETATQDGGFRQEPLESPR